MARTEEELIAKRDQLMARDLEQVAQIKAYGVDLEKKRQVDLTFWAPNQAAADVLVEALKRNEMPPNLTLGPSNQQEANQRWLIRCPVAASVAFITAKENVVTFLLFADKYDCEYDGWGAAIVEAASSDEPASAV
jgi:hypothetical protein